MKSLNKKVLIIEDHPIVIKGLVQIINKQKYLSVVGVATNRQKALDMIKELKPDMATVDISLKDSNGIELIKDITSIYPDCLTLVLSMHDELVYAERAIKAGAKGYIMKQKVTKELLKAIKTVLSGKIYLSSQMSSVLLNKITKAGNIEKSSIINTLSDRELEIFEYIGDGLTTNEIAQKTNLGIKTIESYKNNIKEKLDLKNFTQLIKSAVEWKLKDKT
jgi:DNA-binding NarL/FixJ family response regulator